MIKKSKMKKSAQTFLDWAITDDAMAEYSKNYPIVAVKSDTSVIPEGYTKNPIEQLIKYDLQEAAKQRDSILKEWSNRYDTKSEPKS